MAAVLYRDHVSAPSTALWNVLIGGTKSFNRSDFTGSLLNSVICIIPAAAGGIPAALTNRVIHAFIPSKLPLRRVFSILATGASVVVGIGVNFFVIKFLAANRITLDSFSADKALKLQVLGVLPFLAISPVLLQLGMFGYSGYAAIPIVFGIGATSGYFGHRSLQVIGALSALLAASQIAGGAMTERDTGRHDHDEHYVQYSAAPYSGTQQ
jgi:hypothetical protein